MPSAIVVAKLTPPRVSSDHLRRERLERRWAELLTRRLIAVVAGAGFGKTSFLADWAARTDRPVVWYTLDETDSDAAVFLEHLAWAVAQVVGWPGPGHARAEVNALAQVLFAAERPPVLVFDDVQALRGGSATLACLARLVRHLPAGASIVLASREPPALERARWEVHSDLGELHGTDLAFSEEEIGALFARRFPGFVPETALLRQIAECTQGWAAGLELLLQRLAEPEPLAITRILDSMTSVGSGWFSYFAEEVVTGLDPALRAFLRRTAFLPRLDPGICDLVLGTSGSATYLATLEARNLFTTSTRGTAPVYRYHPLFRVYLQRLATEQETPSNLLRLRRRTARALLENGDVGAAFDELVTIGEGARALALLRKRAVQLLSSGRLEGVRAALEQLPPRALARSPEALAVLATRCDYEGAWARAARLYRRALGAEPGPALRAEVLARLASLEQRRGRNAVALRLARQALGPGSRPRAATRVRILSTLGIAACDSGRIVEGEGYLRAAFRLAETAGDAKVLARVLFLLAANVHYPRGEFGPARAAARRSYELFQEEELSYPTCHSLGVLAFVTLEGGERDAARPLALRALRIARTLEYEAIIGYCEYTVGRIAAESGDPAGARAAYERSVVLGEHTGEAHLQVLPQLGLAALDLAEGNSRRARTRAVAALEVTRRVQDRLGQVQALFLLGRIEDAIDSGTDGSDRSPGRSSGPAERCWDEAERIALRLGARAELHRIWIARLVRAPAPARAALAAFVQGIAEAGHDFLVRDLPPTPRGALLLRLRESGVDPDYVAGLVRRFLTPPAAPAASVAWTRGDEPGGVTVVAPRTDGLPKNGGPERRTPGALLAIEALGPLVVRIGGRVIAREHWRSARARRLFLALLVHRFQWVPKPRLVECLWPGAEPERGENNLRQSIHLLRRVLEPDAPKGEAAYVLVQDDSCRLDPGVGASYDVARFEQLVQAGERSWNADAPEQAQEAFRAALDLWRGEFVEDSPYEESVAAERERLREIFLRALLRGIEARSDSADWIGAVTEARRGLAVDPYHEDLHAFLIEGLIRLGHRREALVAYQEYEVRMTRELRLLPARRIVALAERSGVVGAK